MNIFAKRALATLIVNGFLLVAGGGVAAGPTVVAQFDLSDYQTFQRFENFSVTPFFRIENTFFAEVDKTHLQEISQADIPYEVVDTEPFTRPYYTWRTESLPARAVPDPALERIAEVGSRALYIGVQAIDEHEYQNCHDEPTPVLKREIPLVYMSPMPASPNVNATLNDASLEALLAAVDQDSLYAYNTRLEAFQTRLTLSDSMNAARDWIKAKFESFGYTVVNLDPFWCDDNRYGMSGWTDNIVCIKQGTAEPDKVLVIGGHWDSIVYDGGDPYVYAPGSDDNGSGTATTLEIARVLATTPVKKTIHFVPFGSEENGLRGSWHYATEAANSGMDIELMINMDMIGYTEDTDDDIETSYIGSSRPYAELMAQLAIDHTTLNPYVIRAGSSSDHYPFSQMGYNIANTIEGDFNTVGWHTQLDLTSRMDFPYLAEVTKMCLATLYVVSSYPSSINDAVAYDVGDGQSLQVSWSALSDGTITGYWVYWGLSSETYTDSVWVPGNSADQTTITGLTEGQQYFLTVIAEDGDGLQSFLRPEFTGTPRVVPLAPASVVAATEPWQVRLSWDANEELDFDHYVVKRGETPGNYTVVVPNTTATEYVDTDVSSGVIYEYVVSAVDADFNESANSDPSSAAAATFDQGILLLDVTPNGGGNPTAEEKQTFFDAVFSGFPTTYHHYSPGSEQLSRSIIGQYDAVLWLDDNSGAAPWKQEDLDQLDWYLEYNTNVLLAGWRVAHELGGLASPGYFGPGDLLYDYLGVTSNTEIQDVDCRGGLGINGFSDVAFDPDKVFSIWDGKMGWVGSLTAPDANTWIYLFDSESGDHAGEILGVRRENATNKFAFLSLPFYYLEAADARTAMTEVLEWFGYEITCDCASFGDLNLDGVIEPIDVQLIVNYVYRSLDERSQVPGCPGENGDFDCNGDISPLDVALYVNYAYKSFGSPCDPCLCSPYPTNCP